MNYTNNQTSFTNHLTELYLYQSNNIGNKIFHPSKHKVSTKLIVQYSPI